ncbi:MAG: hypothetical protein ABI571_07145 [Actinomycetota bacterium]
MPERDEEAEARARRRLEDVEGHSQASDEDESNKSEDDEGNKSGDDDVEGHAKHRK